MGRGQFASSFNLLLPDALSTGKLTIVPNAVIVVTFGSLGCAVAILLWWLFLSRAPWSERLGAVLLIIVALFGTSRILHASHVSG